ncbi:MAG: hypothetical protein AB7J13_06675 [Pyrinomonadaceae bacterium]
MKNTVSPILKSIFLILMLVAGLYAQVKEESILNRHVTVDPLFHANIWSAAQDLADQGIPIGFEAREHWNVDMGPRLFLNSGPLRDVLNSISKQDPTYTWQEVDGVINVFPTIDRNKQIVAFLGTRTGPITVNKGDDRASVVERVSKLYHSGQGKEARFFSVIGAGNHLGVPDKFEEQFTIPISDMRTILNRLTKVQAYHPLWTVKKYSNSEELTVVF